MKSMRYGLLLLLATVLLFPEVLGTLAFSEITAERSANLELTDRDGEDGGILAIDAEDELTEGDDEQRLVTLTNDLNQNQNVTVVLDDTPGWEFSTSETNTRRVDPIQPDNDAEFTVDVEDDAGVEEGDYEIISRNGAFIFSQDRTVSFVESDEEDITLEIADEDSDLVLEIGDEEPAVVTDADGNEVTEEAELTSSDEGVISIDDSTVTAEGEGEATVTAEYNGGEDTVDVTVEEEIEPAYFNVEITDLTTAVEEGDDVIVTVDIENEGDEEDTQPIELDIDGLGTTTESVTLTGSEATEEELHITTYVGDEGTYDNTIVTSNDDSDESDEEIIVEEAEVDSDFSVEITETNTPVTEGDALEVTAEIENEGADFDEQSVEIDVGDLGGDAEDIELDSGETTTEEFQVGTEVGDADDYTVTLSSADDEDTTDIVIEEAETDFIVDEIDAEDVFEEEVLEVTAEITNEGEGTDTQTITLQAGGLGGDTAELELNGGETDDVEFEIETESGDEGIYDVVVETEDDNSAETTVEVRNPFTVPPACDGHWDGETAPYDIENIHDLQCISEEPEENYQLVEDIDASYTSGWNDGDGFEPIGTDTPFEGELDGSDHVIDSLFIDRDTEDDIGLISELDGGSIQNIGLNEITVNGNNNVGGLIGHKGAGTVSRTFVTGSVSGEENVGGAIGEAPDTEDDDVEDSYSHASVDGSSNVGGFAGSVAGRGNTQWGEIYATGLVSDNGNVGGLAGVVDTGGNQDLLEDAYWDSENTNQEGSDGGGTSLTTDEMTGADASDNMDGFDFGTWTVGDEDEYIELTNLERPSEPNFIVNIINTNSPIEEGDVLEIDVEIENFGSEAGEQEIVVDVEDLGQDSITVELAEDGSTVETFEFTTTEDDADEYTVSVDSEDSNDEATVEVVDEIAPEFDVTITGTNSAVAEGENLEVDVEIENTGTESDTQDIELDVDGLGSDSTTVELEIDEITEETLEVGTDIGDSGEYTAVVESEDDEDETIIVVDEDPADFQVEITDTNSPVFEGDALEVEVIIQNEGGAEDTQEITLDVDGLGEDTVDVTLAPEASKTETLVVDSDDGDEGVYDIITTLGDDSDGESVEIINPKPVVEDITTDEDRSGRSSNVDIDVDWEVGAGDGSELSEVEIELLDEDGSVIDSETEDIDGTDAEGSNTIDIDDDEVNPDIIQVTVINDDEFENSDTEPYNSP